MDTSADRAAHYREQAFEFRARAAKEPDRGVFKNPLVDLAKQYDRLATQTENGGRRAAAR